MFPAFLQRIVPPGPAGTGNQTRRQPLWRLLLLCILLGLLLLSGILFTVGTLTIPTAWEAAILSLLTILVLILFLRISRTSRKMISGLEASKNRLEQQIARRDEFTSRLSHKLRTSLSNLTLINNLVHDSRLTSQQKELVETLKASTNTLIEDVNNMVEIASPVLRVQQKSIISFDLTRVLEEAVEILGSGESGTEEVTLERSDHITNFLIGDPVLLRNLVVNIVRGLGLYKKTSTPVAIRVETLRETPAQIRLELRFSILTELQDDLVSYVDSLKRGEAQQASNLANAFSLLRQNDGGLITLHTGKETILSVSLDFTKDSTRSVITQEEAQARAKEERSSVALKDAKVLLVEDNEINQKIVLLSLTRKVSRIDVAANGKEAVEKFGSRKYDLILMDIMMPVMDGLTATREIRKIESEGEVRTPIIAITANALVGDRDQCLAAGADDYIAKPFQADVLVRKMKNLLTQ